MQLHVKKMEHNYISQQIVYEMKNKYKEMNAVAMKSWNKIIFLCK